MGLRIALLMNLAPRKHGSMEDWILAFCQEASRRGHRVDTFLGRPMLPSFGERLRQSGTQVIEDLVEFSRGSPPTLARRLAAYDLLHLNYIPPRSRVALAAYAAWPARVLYMAHTDFLAAREGRVRQWLRHAVDHLTMLRVHSLAGVSEYIRDKEGRRFGLPPSKTLTLFNGVDTRRFRPRPRPPEPRPVELITIANLVRYKGVHHLLRALAILRSHDIRLRVVGDGPEEKALRELAVELGLERQAEFLGLRSDVHELLGAADICIQPTLAEAFGLTIAEAMASGCAVVATRVGGIPELIEHERSGLLVRPGDRAELAAAIHRLLVEPDLRRRLGEAARQRACERFELMKTACLHVDWCEAAAEYPPYALASPGVTPALLAAESSLPSPLAPRAF